MKTLKSGAMAAAEIFNPYKCLDYGGVEEGQPTPRTFDEPIPMTGRLPFTTRGSEHNQEHAFAQKVGNEALCMTVRQELQVRP